MKARHFIFAAGLLIAPLIALGFGLYAWPRALWRVCYSRDQNGTASHTAQAHGISEAYPEAQKKGKESFFGIPNRLVPSHAGPYAAEAKKSLSHEM